MAKKVNNISGTATMVGVWDVIQVINEANFDILEEAGADAELTEIDVPPGTVLYGNFTKIKLNSGTVRAYGVGVVDA